MATNTACHPYKTTRKITVNVLKIFGDWKMKGFLIEWQQAFSKFNTLGSSSILVAYLDLLLLF
jgi:hypothetical protein